MFNLETVQTALRDFQLDGWLLFDFRGSNLLARRILDLADKPLTSRRFAYCIPARGAPRKLVHRIEAGTLDHLPGDRTVYLRWQEFQAGIGTLLAGLKHVALEYSPRNANPYVSRVDAGVVELVRSFEVEPASSGDLIQLFEACWDDDQWRMHREAAVHTDSAYARVWKFVAGEVRAGRLVTERMVQQEIEKHFTEHGLFADHPPIVAVGPHSGDPHYETGDTPLKEGDFVLVDLWAKLNQPRAVYSDLTRVGFIGTSVPGRYEEIFQIVARARDAGIAKVRSAFASGETLQGWQVDQATRDVIEAAGYGEAFVHRTGHSIGQETHGSGANMDNLETHEQRRVLRRTCFSIEPGIYLTEFGVRSEVDVFVDAAGTVHVTGGELQTKVVPILAEF
ncbi:MAG TPA: M24 family metallopeptidase [Planctomycetaceae bacterium]|jgi:Xaa-Pro aminopeptidase|nr:M24 family metallopeptidase [Planctomycetaceae bacterium]